jgi:glycosyltransferase involved in cell wall biosynthesis
MMDKPLVSVLMTTYNGSRFIRETIESILSQTFSNFEFLIIDDCSSDETAAIVEQYDDRRIRLIRNQSNLGIPRSRNLGIEQAAGTYMAVTDHDDISAPDRLTRQVAFLEAHPDVVLLGTGSNLLSDRRLMVESSWSGSHVLRWKLLTASPFPHSSACFRLSTIRRHGLRYRVDVSCADDHDLFYRLSRVGEIECLPEPLVTWRAHGGNASLVMKSKNDASAKRVLDDIYHELFGEPVSERKVELALRVLMHRETIPDKPTLIEVGTFLSRLLSGYLSRAGLAPEQSAEVSIIASAAWWHIVQAAVKIHGPSLYCCYRMFPDLSVLSPSSVERMKLWVLTLLGPEGANRVRSVFGLRSAGSNRPGESTH